jgi:SNF family Na+-dependent transporter
MSKWLDRVGIILAVLGGAVYVRAKIHYFSHYGEPGFHTAHLSYTIGLILIGLVLMIINRIRKRLAQGEDD